MKKLPIGIQDFSEIIKNSYLYIDKTEYVYRLLQGKYYFLSRPRRFGKSLLISTLRELFSGNKDLFNGLWIYDKIEWKKYPVIHISFANIGFQDGLENAIESELHNIAKEYQIELTQTYHNQMFRELIEKLAKTAQVVILIDEYDKPIIEYIDDIPKADANRKILRDFYSILKDSDAYIRFLFMTGVSKFSKISIFSELNNLDDITIDERFSTMLGYTQGELIKYFEKHLILLKDKYLKNPNIEGEIKKWYNGYSWDGQNYVYNPFSILNLFSGLSFQNF